MSHTPHEPGAVLWEGDGPFFDLSATYLEPFDVDEAYAKATGKPKDDPARFESLPYRALLASNERRVQCQKLATLL